jgi:hypothetical protein
MTYYAAALTNPQLNKLRNIGTSSTPQYATDQLAFLCPNAPVFNARTVGDITGDPVGVIAYGTVSFGATADIKIGQRLVISPTNNIRDLDAITCRVRDTPTGTTSGNIPINEISKDIPGGSYIFIVNDYPLMDRLARITSTSPTYVQSKDFALAYEDLPPLVAGIQMSYVQRVSGGIATFSLDASSSYATDDDTFSLPIASFLWEFDNPGAVNVIGGGTTQDNIEFEIDEGFQWGHLTIEDEDGVTTTFHFQIHPWGTTYTPVLGFEGANIEADITTGYGVSVVAFTDVSDVLDNTWITIVRNDEQYNGVAGQLITGDPYYVEFVGLFSTETSTGQGDPTLSFRSDVSFEITGIGQRLAQINMQAIGMRNSASPTLWDYIDELMPWRAVVHIWARHSTASTLVPLVFTTDVKNTSYFYPYFATPLGGNLLSSINYILNSINAALEFWPNGTVEGVRDIRYETELDRLGYLTLFGITEADFYSIAVGRRHLPPVGKIYAEGGFYNPFSGSVVAVKAIAPGTAQQIGTDTPTLGQQVLVEAGSQLEGQIELNERAGNFNAIVSDDGNTVVIVFPGGYTPTVYPSKNVLYTITYSDALRGIDYDTSTKWFCINTSSSHINEQGKHTFTATFVRLIPFAAPGDAIPQIAQGDILPAIPDLPPFPAFDFEFPETMFPLAGLALGEIDSKVLEAPDGQVVKKDGSTVWIKSATQSYLLQNFIPLTTPESYETTPSDLGNFEIQQVLFDILNTGAAPSTANKYGYQLESDGTNSHVRRTANIYDRPPAWLTGADIAGLYTVLRGTNVDGGLMVYRSGETSGIGSWSKTFDFTASNGGWSLAPGYSDPFPTYTPGSGWTSTNDGVSPGTGGNTIQLVVASFAITGISVTWDVDVNNPGTNPRRIEVSLNGTGTQTFALGNATGNQSASFSPTGTVNTMLVSVDAGNNGSPPYHSTIISVTITGTGTNPFTNAEVRYSSNRGNTFAAAVTVGASPGSVGGLDVNRSSETSYAAMLGKVRKATTLGGAYADHTSYGSSAPVCVIIPYFRWNSTTNKQTTASDPDYLVALNVADTGTNTLYRVDGATAAKTNITPVAGITFDNPNCATTSYGTHIAVIGVVAGDRRLYVSSDMGANWELEATGLTSDAQFIRTRRGDTRAKKLGGGDNGQLSLINGILASYSVDWGETLANRNLPITADGMDILG